MNGPEDRNQSQPAPEAATTVATLADAPHAAHQAGIVHRDVKPANVLLSASGSPKLADCGPAESLNDEDGLTQTGAIMGRLSYMAPEKSVGRTRDATPGTDIYSLGALLYEMLTGRPPFQGTNRLETMISIVASELVSIQVLQRRVPRDLVTIRHKDKHRFAALPAEILQQRESHSSHRDQCGDCKTELARLLPGRTTENA